MFIEILSSSQARYGALAGRHPGDRATSVTHIHQPSTSGLHYVHEFLVLAIPYPSTNTLVEQIPTPRSQCKTKTEQHAAAKMPQLPKSERSNRQHAKPMPMPNVDH